MGYIPIKPLVEKLSAKAVEWTPVIGPGLKYVKTAKKVTKFTSPVKATTYTVGMLLEICGGKYAKYTAQCTAWATMSAAGIATGNPALIGIALEIGQEILEDFCGE